MYLVRTEYRINDISTYLRLKVRTFQVAYQYGYRYVPSTYLFSLVLVQHFSNIWRVHMCTYWLNCSGSASPDSPPPWSALLTSSTSPSQQHSACCKRACGGLGLQVGASMMSCKVFKHSCKVQVQRFYQRDKTKSFSGLKLSSVDGDWDIDLERWLEYWGYYC